MAETKDLTRTRFTRLIADLKPHENGFIIDLPQDWLQGRTAYGGLTAALCLEATIRSFPDLPPLRSAHFSFAGPGVGNLRTTAKIIRQGSSTVFTSAEITGEMGIATRANFCFGSERTVGHDYIKMPMPTVTEPDLSPPFFIWDNLPNFMQHFEGRFAGGERPFSSGATPEFLVWLRHCDEECDNSIVSLLALADVLPPAFFVLISKPTPISTVTWSIDFLGEEPKSKDAWWLGKSTSEYAQKGFSTESTVIWSSDGKSVISGRQNVAVF